MNAQTINICTNFCIKDLSSPIPGLTIDSIDISYCKQMSGSCVTIDKFDVQYKENSCPRLPMIDKCDNTLSTLVMRVYYPSNQNYNACKLPAIIFFMQAVMLNAVHI
ncbi:MAG: hypothetical protein JST21_01060 [Bacteroidetes bacterium]|nr:hypothetical protein [Bacteroidota bacterium]